MERDGNQAQTQVPKLRNDFGPRTTPPWAELAEGLIAQHRAPLAYSDDLAPGDWDVAVHHMLNPSRGDLDDKHGDAASPPCPLGACSVEAELVALDVLHPEARLVVLIGKQELPAYRAERDQTCALGLQCGEALFTHEPGADPHVKMHPVLDNFAFGNALEVHSRAHA